MRAVLAILGGIVVGLVAMTMLAFIGGMIFPTSVVMHGYDSQQFASAFEHLPIGPKAAILASWFGGALIGAALAKLIVRRGWAAWTIAALFTLYVLVSVFFLPMPAWMQVLAVALPLVAGLIANHLVKDAPDPADIEPAPDA